MKWITLHDLVISEVPNDSIVLTMMNNRNVFAYDGNRNLKGLSEIQKHHPEVLCSIIKKPNSVDESQEQQPAKDAEQFLKMKGLKDTLYDVETEAIAFATWIENNGYVRYEKYYWTNDECETRLSDQQLYHKYQQLKSQKP